MLTSLSVENYALIDRLRLDLSRSLNIITGETGAGKSILLGALGLLLGNRADAAVIKDGTRNCVVEGVFSVAEYGLEGFFAENDLDWEPMTVIRRVVAPTGKSRCYINDLPVQQNVLKELSGRLLDIHSQHQSLMLGESDFRTEAVDALAGNGEALSAYREVYAKLRTAERQLADTQRDAERDNRDREWLEHQVEQLSVAELRDGEQSELETEQSELTHAEEIKSAISANVALLDGDEKSILAELRSARQAMSGVEKYYPRAHEFAERLDSALIELRDVERELSAENDRVDSDPQRLAMIDDRLALIYSLQKKHKVAGVAELILIKRDYEARLAAITGSDEAIAALEKQVAALKKEAVARAATLTGTRRKAAGEVSAHVEKTVASLGIPNAKFIVEVLPAPLKADGADDVRFLFSANRNIAPAPVEKIASGGEVSRLMLALKSLIARNRNLPTIIFDEIDTGVSGPVADAMGTIIERLGGTMQVINITHLPQVASKGDTHFVVWKDDGGEVARTMITRLTPADRVAEIAKMLSGQAVTDAAIAQARLLLGEK